jgi:hypothetical protein
MLVVLHAGCEFRAAPAVLDLDPAIETLVSIALCVAFSSLGHRLRIALSFCSPALEGLSPTVDRCGSAVEEVLNSFGQLGIHRLGGGVVCGDELVVVVGDDGADEVAGVMGGAALHRVHVRGWFASVLVLGDWFVEVCGVGVAAAG